MGIILNSYTRRRRSKPTSLLVGFGIILVVFGYGTLFSKRDHHADFEEELREINANFGGKRKLLEFVHKDRSIRQASNNQSLSEFTTSAPEKFNNTDETENTKPQGIYPPDIFDIPARRKGAVILHIIGMLYMFTALAIVCDEFFVPALEVIIRKWEMSDDVAGATFMAAGGSAPELFTSFIGVFLAKSNVGIGTIVGSAVFNILFVIGMCSLFSKEILKLTWWPLFRDCAFYIVSLAVVIGSFKSGTIEWYESVLMISMYLAYVTFMKFNKPIETFVKKTLNRSDALVSCRGNSSGSKISPQENGGASRDDGRKHKHHTTFSYGIVQLMMHSLDPVSDAKTTDKSATLYAMARLKVISPRAARTLSSKKRPGSTSGRVSRSTNLKDIVEEGDYPESNRTNYRHSIGATPTTVVYEKEGFRVVPNESTSANSLVFDVVSNQQAKAMEDGVFDDASQIPRASSISNPTQAFGENGSFPSSFNQGSGLRHIDSMNDPDKFHITNNNRENGVHEANLTSSGTNGSIRKIYSENGNALKKENSFQQAETSEDTKSDFNANCGDKQTIRTDSPSSMSDDSDDFEEALDMSWPDSCSKRIVYLLLAPINVPLWLCVPDVRRPGKEKYFMATFFFSIISIGLYSYFMVFMAHQIGETAGVDEEVMGLTFLAAGTSVPDLITSVIVARKGLGDMAVSSSVGSNIFDVTIGLPVPWLIWSMISSGRSVIVESGGLFCSILLLFIMLLFVVISIAVCRWQMSKALGFTMLGLYAVFLILSLLLQFDVMMCPAM